MIALATDCLLFRMAGGESIPVSADMLSVEMLGDTAARFEPDFVSHAVRAVFHYFKHELARRVVQADEFAAALEKVLRCFQLPATPPPPHRPMPHVAESDLCRLAQESGDGCELFFFPRLRDELRQQLQHPPRILRFRGLRGCVKRLTGARHWCQRCRTLEDQIVAYLRRCLSAEAGNPRVALLVD